MASLNETTDKILGFLENPKREGSWDVRGLVVGSVQSGKTSNFIGFLKVSFPWCTLHPDNTFET